MFWEVIVSILSFSLDDDYRVEVYHSVVKHELLLFGESDTQINKVQFVIDRKLGK